MDLGALKNITTYNELNNYMKLINEVANEGNETVDNILHIDNEIEGFSDLSYIASSVVHNNVVKHWFTYKENNLYGLASCSIIDFKIKKVTDADYLCRFECAPNMSEVWFCVKPNSLTDLVIEDKVVLEDITSYDVLQIGYLHMVQLNFADSIGLMCYQSDIGISSIFIPKDVDDFEDWYMRKCKADAYQGYMKDITAQEMFHVEFEVENTIFHLDNYRRVKLNM